MQWYLNVLKNYVGFQGRARRTEYWMFTLFNVIISVILTAIDMLLLGTEPGQFGVLSTLYSLAVLLPSLAVSFRRLHDTDRTAWWILIGLIPLVGAIVLIVFYCQEGTRGPNQYGPDLKALAGVDVKY